MALRRKQKQAILSKTYDELTTKQQRFVDYYDGNGLQAAEKAGYSHPGVEANRLLKNANVASAIRERESRRRQDMIWTREQRQEFWTNVASGAETQVVVTGFNLDGSMATENVPPKMTDRLKASEMLARSEGDFIDKVALGGIDKDGDIKSMELIFVSPKPRVEDRPKPKLVSAGGSSVAPLTPPKYEWGDI